MAQKPTVHWSFRAVWTDIDLLRILREATDAGLSQIDMTVSTSTREPVRRRLVTGALLLRATRAGVPVGRYIRVNRDGGIMSACGAIHCGSPGAGETAWVLLGDHEFDRDILAEVEARESTLIRVTVSGR